jgi:hypothetical protein
MRRLYILNDGRTAITENMEYGSPVGIKEVHEIDGLSDEAFQHLLENRPAYKPVKDKQGNLIAFKSPQRRIEVSKREENI